jgi:SAM-dependent methyltransferase
MQAGTRFTGTAVTTREQTRRFFDSIAGRYDRVYAPSSAESRARMMRVTSELLPASRLLDLGVGTGRELSSLLDAGHAVVGLDLSREMLARCARRARPIPLVQADLWDTLPFESGSFDAVLALHGTLAHPPTDGAPNSLSAEVARVLTRGGLLVLEVPLPRWVEEDRTGDDEREISRIDDARAVVTDRVTGAAIQARLYRTAEWREALSSRFSVRKTLEEGDELFLVAAKRWP